MRDKNYQFLLFLHIYFYISLFGTQINSNYSKFKQIQNNTIHHLTYGNISNNGSYKFATWNKGNSNFHNKIDDIKIILNDISPDCLSIYEANYDIYSRAHLSGYRIKCNRLHISNSIARSMLLIRDNI